ncbi:MAG: phosphoribosyltransferase family protein [Thermomicrobiales bacterium]
MSEGFRADESAGGHAVAGSISEVQTTPGRHGWQPVHLPFKPRLRATNEAFAHPFEAVFARLLTEYRVRWSYEPTTFPIRWDDQRRPVEFITPDFYLPDHRLYVELTTMRQRLVTRKHRKIRLLRAIYPNIRVKVLYRRDYVRLMLVHGGEAARADGEPGRMILDRETIAVRLDGLAQEIARDLGGGAADPPLLLACGAGGRRVLDDLSSPLRAAGLGFDTAAVTVRNMSVGTAGPGGGVAIRLGSRQVSARDLAGRRVLVVHGIVSSGLRAAHVARWLRRRGAREVQTLTCLDRRSARVVEVPLRYVGFDVPPDLLVGYGLDLRRSYRDASFVATYSPFDGIVGDAKVSPGGPKPGSG